METTHDAFLGGRLTLTQPKNGYRAGQDPVLLAAACPIKSGQSLLDLGCGVGALGLCVLARVPGVAGRGIELDPWLVRLAQTNGLSAEQGDIFALKPDENQRADWVLSNPPFFDVGSGRASPNPQRQAGRQGGGIAAWVQAAMSFVKPRGHLGLIIAAAQVPAALAALSPPIWRMRVAAPAGQGGGGAGGSMPAVRPQGVAQ